MPSGKNPLRNDAHRPWGLRSAVCVALQVISGALVVLWLSGHAGASGDARQRAGAQNQSDRARFATCPGDEESSRARAEARVVEFKIGASEFAAPANHVYQFVQGRDFVNLQALWPHMSPRTRQNAQLFGYRPPFSLIRVLLDTSPRRTEGQESLEHAIKAGWLGAPRKVPSLGLVEYPDATLERGEYYRVGDPNVRTPSGLPLVIHCQPYKLETPTETNRCEVRYRRDDGVFLEYRYYKKNLPHWREIHAAVGKLLDCFRGKR